MNIASFTSQPRGLHNFIAEIRSCANKDDERARVDKELANIRAKFSQSGSLNSYQKKKYVWKMCYIYMLGYDVDFGYMEFISLLGSTKFQEKSVGYMAISLMLRPGDELMTLAINSMRNDVVGYLHHGKTLALACVSNIGGSNIAEALVGDVSRLVISPSEDSQQNYQSGPDVDVGQVLQNKALLCKKASLCLLRLYRTNPDSLDLSEWVRRTGKLLEDRDLGVVTSAMSLVLGFASSSPVTFEPLIPFVISILTRLVVNRTCHPDYMYYRIPCPWLQVKCLRFLQYYKLPDKTDLELLAEALYKILNQTEVSDSANKSNADHSVLFEAINLMIAYGQDAPSELRSQSLTLLGRFIGVKDANIRYLGLDAMTRLARLDGPRVAQAHQSTILDSLRDADISVRKRALDLSFVMVDEKNAKEVVGELVTVLATAESAIKEDMVVKIAILAEKYSHDIKWYIDTMSKVILVAGDFVFEPVWHRVVILVTNDPEAHEYVAERMLQAVQSKWAHETAIALAGYLLGEVGVNICERPGMSGYDQFAALHQHFSHCTPKVQAILLTSYMKLVNLYPDTREIISDVFRKYSESSLLDLQQRACEYLALSVVSQDVMENVLNAMPPYAERENPLLTIIETEKETSDKPAWNVVKGSGGAAGGRRESNAEEENVAEGHTKPTTAHAAAAPANVDLLAMDDDDNGDLGGFAAYSAPSSASSHSHSHSHSAAATAAAPANGGSGSSTVVGIDASVLPNLRKWFNNAVIAQPNQRVLLYEDAYISIHTTAEYRQHQGRLSLYFTNKSGDVIENLRVSIPEYEYISVKQKDPPTRLSPAEEGQLAIAVASLKPFAEVPAFEVNFSCRATRSAHKYPLRLPISAAAFFEPVPSDKATYMARWKALEADKTEVQEVFKSTTRSVDAAFVQYIRETIFPAMKIGIAQGLDTDTTITGSCSFRTGSTGPEGNPLVVGAMVRIEADLSQGRFRITVRAKHALISQALKSILQAQLM